jgi:hypothetical protein
MSRHVQLVRRLLLFCVIGCGDQLGPDPQIHHRVQVALIPTTPSKDLDLLFVIDDTELDKTTNLKNAFPSFIDELGTLPDLHLGVVTSDLGTKGFEDPVPGPSIGSGPGSCSGEGKQGFLQTNGTSLVQGRFISDVAAADGTRTTNYSTTLSAAFSALASVGAGGCGFEQPLEAMRLALLDPSGINSGFVRTEARLAIIALQDEDDCSFAHSTLLGNDSVTLGPLQSFRCTRFGVTCADGGRTTDDMNMLGEKDACRSRADSLYLPAVTRYKDFLGSFKADAREELFAVIAGAPEPVTVEARTPPGGGTPVPALAHSCSYQGANGTEVASPAVRMAELVATVPRGRFESVCEPNLEPAARSIARQIRTLLGDSCLPEPIATNIDCVVSDQRADGSERELPLCEAAGDCYHLDIDPSCSASALRLVVKRASAPASDTMIAVRCAPYSIR